MIDEIFLLYVLFGKTFIYALQKFPLIRDIKIKFFRELFECDFCLGVWIYSILALLLQIALFRDVLYFPVVSEIFTGIVTSFAVHIFSIGWKDKFGTIIIKE